MRSTSVLFALAVVVGCDAPADPDTVQDRITRLVPEIVDETTAAADGADATFAAIETGLSALDRLAPGVLPDLGLGDGEPAKRAVVTAFGEDGETGADVAAELNTRIFSEANYEGDGTYRIPASELCADPADVECADLASRAQLRIHAELAGDGVDFTLQVGADRAEPITVGLRSRALTVSVDLGELAAAMTAVVASEPGMIVELAGTVSARLDVLGPAHAAVAINIDDPIHVEVAEAGSEPVRFDTALAQPLLRVELDGVAAEGAVEVGLGSTQVHVPGELAGEPATDVDLAGFTASATLAAGTLQLRDLSLGDRTTTMSIGGARALAVDLNPTHGRAVDLTVTGDATDATFTFAPAFDLRVVVDHAVLGDGTPRYDVTRVGFDATGGVVPALRVTTDAVTLSDQLAIAAGVLVIETSPAEYGATITAGQCVGEEWRTDAAGTYSVVVPTVCQ